MMLSVSQQARSLSKVFLADVTPVRPYAGVRKYMLVEIADGRKCFLADDAGGDVAAAVLEAFVIEELTRADALLAAFLALEALLV